MTQEELKKILAAHELWLMGENEGVRASLRGANLRDANLSDASLSGADLSGADLDISICSIDQIGSRNGRTTYNITHNKVWCGCFTGTFEEWIAKIRKTYPDEACRYRREYEAAIAYFKAIAEAKK